MKTEESVHEGIKPFKCDICDYYCSQKSDMNTYVVSVHEGKKPFKCDICEYRCSLNQQMKQHVTKNHEENKLWYVNHIQSVHVQEKTVSAFV